MMKKRLICFCIVFLVLFIPISFAKTIHPISKETIKIEQVTTVEEVDIEPEEKRSVANDVYYYYGTGGLIAKEENSEITYYHKDNLGSTRTVTNEFGEVIESNTYLPYGENLDSSRETFTFTGKELDSSGLQYFGARYYDPSIGRFITIDPIWDGINHYEYAASNPVKFVDPDGLSEQASWGTTPWGQSSQVFGMDWVTGFYGENSVPVTRSRFEAWDKAAATGAPDDLLRWQFPDFYKQWPTPYDELSTSEKAARWIDATMQLIFIVGLANMPYSQSRQLTAEYDARLAQGAIMNEMSGVAEGAVLGQDRHMDAVLKRAEQYNKEYKTDITLGVHGDPKHPGMFKIIGPREGILLDNIPIRVIAEWVNAVKPPGARSATIASCYGSSANWKYLARNTGLEIVGETGGLKVSLGLNSMTYTQSFSHGGIKFAKTIGPAKVARFFP